MENQNSMLELVLYALAEPRYSRQEYLKIKQTESGFSINVFRHKLEDAITLWYNEIHKNDWRIISKNVTEMSLSLTDCSKGKVIGGSFGDKELALLALDIDEAFKEEKETISKITKREVLLQAHNENGGRLTSEQLKNLAKKNKLSQKAMSNLYAEMLDDLK